VATCGARPASVSRRTSQSSRPLARVRWPRLLTANKEGGMGIEQAQAEGDAAIKRLLGESDLPFGDIGPRPTDAWI